MTIVGVGLYMLWLALTLIVGVAHGEIDPEKIRRISCGWGSVDSAVYNGDWGTRNGEVWCEWCHRYHPQ